MVGGRALACAGWERTTCSGSEGCRCGQSQGQGQGQGQGQDGEGVHCVGVDLVEWGVGWGVDGGGDEVNDE